MNPAEKTTCLHCAPKSAGSFLNVDGFKAGGRFLVLTQQLAFQPGEVVTVIFSQSPPPRQTLLILTLKGFELIDSEKLTQDSVVIGYVVATEERRY